jgi:hypothetical protein
MVEKQLLHTDMMIPTLEQSEEGEWKCFFSTFKSYSHLVRYGNSLFPYPEKYKTVCKMFLQIYGFTETNWVIKWL